MCFVWPLLKSFQFLSKKSTLPTFFSKERSKKLQIVITLYCFSIKTSILKDVDVTCQRAEYQELIVNNLVSIGFTQIDTHAKNTQPDKSLL